MNLKTLLSALPVKAPERFSRMRVDSVEYDSRVCTAGTLFVCLRGAFEDGHRFARDAYDRGCRAFIAEEPLSLPDDAAVILTDNTRQMLALVSSELYGRPAEKLTLIGVTGTKGKTTTCHMIYNILNGAGIPTGYIGSTGVMFSGVRTSTLRTTPESSDIYTYLHKMLAAGIKTVVIEVSSQAIKTDRIYGLRFDTCVFTNLSPDHIGEHEHASFEEYRDTKARLFSDYGCRYIVYNADDEAAGYMLGGASALTVSVSTKDSGADLYACEPRLWRESGALGVDFTLAAGDVRRRIRLRTPGLFSVYDALFAIGVARRFLVPEDKIVSALATTSPIGRFEVVEALPYATFVIDYAHNEASLRAALSTLREYSPARLIVLLGCVGGRTYTRRAPVGRAISELADLCILTSDDPNYEDPMEIIREILAGFGDRDTPFVCIPDRAEAIEYAVKEARPGDIVLLAGKGHENFIVIEGEHRPFSERSVIMKSAAEIMIEA